MTLAESSRQLI